VSIYKNSRYTKTPLYNHDGNLVFKRRKRFEFSIKGAVQHRFMESDRLDNLARDYYGDAQLWWVILDSNPKYRAEIDIVNGDILVIPAYEEVMKCLT